MQNKHSNKTEGGKRFRRIREKLNGPPLVSIITVVYNGHRTLEETIQSVVNQNYPNIEYLIIDGGSTDGTMEILKKYDDTIDYWISEPDKGVYHAMNKGIEIAQGEWLYFLGADDKLYDEKVLQRFLSKPVNSLLLYGNVIWGDTDIIYDGEFFKNKFYLQNICQQAIFYHRDLFQMIGKFDLKYKLVSDWVFNMKAFGLKNTNPVFVDTIVAKYSTEGMSTGVLDSCFEQNRDILYKDIFGTWRYLYVKLKDRTILKLISLAGYLKRIFIKN